MARTDTVAITVTPVADAPVAMADGFTVAEEGTLTVAASAGLLANDADADNQTPPANAGLTVTGASTTSANGGTVNANADGSFTYTPAVNFFGTDSFTYQARDAGGLTSATATVTVAVGGVNDAPAAVNDAAATNEGTAVTTNVTGNDTDPDGDDLSVTAAVLTSGSGTVSFAPGGDTITFTPAANFFGVATIAYTASDPRSASANATLTVTVNAVDDLPVAGNDAASVAEDASVSGSLSGNDTPSGDGGNGYALAAQAANGVAAVTAAGAFTYTPNPDFNGADSFTYQLTDANGSAATATVSVTVGAVNDAPVAAPDVASAVEDGGPVVIAAASLLANDTDRDAGDTRRIVSVAAAGVGAVSLNAAGDVVYDPGANFQALNAGQSASDLFTYTAADAAGAQASATVTVRIAGANEPAPPPPPPPPPSGPTASDDTLAFGAGADVVDGDGGNDTIRAGSGNDRVDGNDGNDLIFGQDGDDELHGNEGDDRIEGEEGNDRLGGGNGNDRLAGDGGNDTLFGGTGNDTLFGDAGDDELSGENGQDTLEGGSGNDRLFGNDGDDVLRGNDGNDELQGGDGNDRLDGGNGDDRLAGGANDDLLIGGSGADTFVFETNFRSDRIEDFAGEDVLQFSATRFNSFDTLRSSGALQQSGADTLIDDGNGNVLTLQNVAVASLQADDFRFV